MEFLVSFASRKFARRTPQLNFDNHVTYNWQVIDTKNVKNWWQLILFDINNVPIYLLHFSMNFIKNYFIG